MEKKCATCSHWEPFDEEIQRRFLGKDRIGLCHSDAWYVSETFFCSEWMGEEEQCDA